MRCVVRRGRSEIRWLTGHTIPVHPSDNIVAKMEAALPESYELFREWLRHCDDRGRISDLTANMFANYVPGAK